MHKYTNTNLQKHKYTNTAYEKMTEIPNILLLETPCPSVRSSITEKHHIIHSQSYIVKLEVGARRAPKLLVCYIFEQLEVQGCQK